MAEQTLTKWINAGFPHVKAESGLPGWLLPERSLNDTAAEVGDEGLLQLADLLDLGQAARDFLGKAPEPAALSPQDWQEAVRKWPSLPRVRPVVEAFFDLAGTVMAQFKRIQSKIDPMVICRNMAVLLFAPFTDQGRPLLREVATVLGGDASEPAKLLVNYAESVARGDIPKLERVNQCVVKYNAWQEWASVLQEQVLRCRCIPRLIAVAPAPSVELASILALMIEEGQHDEPGRDYPEYPDS